MVLKTERMRGISVNLILIKSLKTDTEACKTWLYGYPGNFLRVKSLSPLESKSERGKYPNSIEDG